ncbi:uncharacterized protein B0T23DRAFT_407879 [Neurospora hispaniola]|uniref:Potassium channel domain-containing protein n=1 Tax=Neurospora hispaniola TaxID=588809 RepID=A0AAJ0HZ90_9PEZI|nr:hypothetical protein B0T23DRAFT_407879 [Neurospora hispaniola]
MRQQSSPPGAGRGGRLNSDRPTSIFTFSDPVRSRPRPDPTSSSKEPPPNNEMRTLFNGHIKLRGRNDNLPQKWWPASTAIPLLVATIGPLSHVLSIASLVTTWKVTLPNSGSLPEGKDDNGIGIPDPKWEINANIVSLICGFAGNFFLLLNFTGRVRAFLVPFQTLGLLFLGLVISSISRFAANVSADKIIKRHQEHSRRSTVGMSVTNEKELREKLGLPPKRKVSNARRQSEGRRAFSARRSSLAQYGRLVVAGRLVTFRRHSRAGVGGASEGHLVERAADAKGGENENRTKEEEARQKMLKFDSNNDKGKGTEEITRNGSGEKFSPQDKRKERRQKLLLLKEDRDRFETMRQIQDETKRWKQYGDITPKSNIGKPFFIVWSLIAVPIVTVLFQEMSSTVVRAVNRGAFKVADWTIMPTSKRGVLDKYIQKHPWLQKFVGKRQDAEEPSCDDGAGTEQPRNLVGPAEGADEQEEDLPSLLSQTIKSIAHDLRFSPQKRYSYEEWQLFTQLIQFTQREDDSRMTWDWLSEDSPLLADITEAEWVLDRLCESLDRYTRSSSHQCEVMDAELDPLRIEIEQGPLNNRKEESERGRRNRNVSPS